MGEVVKLPPRKRAEPPRQSTRRSLGILRDCAQAERVLAETVRLPLGLAALRALDTTRHQANLAAIARAMGRDATLLARAPRDLERIRPAIERAERQLAQAARHLFA
jgi:hypothetical protein